MRTAIVIEIYYRWLGLGIEDETDAKRHLARQLHDIAERIERMNRSMASVGLCDEDQTIGRAALRFGRPPTERMPP